MVIISCLKEVIRLHKSNIFRNNSLLALQFDIKFNCYYNSLHGKQILKYLKEICFNFHSHLDIIQKLINPNILNNYNYNFIKHISYSFINRSIITVVGLAVAVVA